MSRRNSDEEDLIPIAPEPVTPRAPLDTPPEMLEPGKQFNYRVFKPPGKKDWASEAAWGAALAIMGLIALAVCLLVFGHARAVPLGLMTMPLGMFGFGFSYLALQGMKQLGNMRGKGPAQVGLALGFLEGVVFVSIIIGVVIRRMMED